MKHIMMDIETMGTGADAAVISVELCVFDPKTGEVGAKAEFHSTFGAMRDIGRKFEPDTVKWWMQQDSEAQQGLFRDDADVDAGVFCRKIGRWIENIGEPRHLRIWAKDPTFDVMIMRSLFERCEVKWTGRFWHEYSVRTMLLMGKALKIDDVERVGFAHGALNDAVHQAKQVMNVMSGVVRR